MKNKLLYTFLFTLLVVAGLFAMHFCRLSLFVANL